MPLRSLPSAAPSRKSEPTPRDGRAGSSRLPWRVLVPVAIACAALGMVFGGMEVNVVAFAKEAGVVRYAGVILMSWAFGSLVAGAIAGAITWRASAAKRFRVGALSSRGVAAAPAVRRSPSGGSCAAADAQRNGHRANPDRIRCGHPIFSGPDTANRGTGMDLDRYGRWCGGRRGRALAT